MKRFTYPAVLYNDEELFALVVPDLGLVSDGPTVEKAFEEMHSQLEIFLNCSLYLEYEIPPATGYKEVSESKAKHVVLLVTEKAEGNKNKE